MVTRRDVLKGIGAVGVGAVFLRPQQSAANHVSTSRFIFDPAPFTLGVASGDPTSSSVIIWTRYTAADAVVTAEDSGTTTIGGINVASNPSIAIDYEVATDTSFSSIVQSGTVNAVPATGYSVHVNVTGLSAGQFYYYRFKQGSSISRVGRTKTMPTDPTSLKFAFFSCQAWPTANYEAFRHLAQRAGTANDIDFVVHLGDTIYDGGSPPSTAGFYRNKHAQFRAEPKLREAYANFPFIHTWDDHEVQDNLSHKTTYDANKAAGYQAFYEHMPIRAYTDMSGSTLIEPNIASPVLPSDWKQVRVFRRFTYGGLLDLAMIDCKQYRHGSNSISADVGKSMLAGVKDDVSSPWAQLATPNQRSWLLDILGSQTAKWKCIGSPVGFVHRDATGGIWDSYRDERWQLLKQIRDNNVRRVVMLSGDQHQARVNLCTVHNADANFDSSDALAVATEFMAPPISSGTKPAAGSKGNTDLQVSPNPTYPWIKWEDLNYHGYAVCAVSMSSWVTTIFGLRDDTTTLNQGTPPTTPTCVRQLVQYTVTQADSASAPTLLKTGGFDPMLLIGC